MKALTLHQPWASLIAIGAKTIETRSWSTKHRGPIAIHAGKRDGFMAGLYGRGMYGDADALWKLPDGGFGDERLLDPRRYEDAFEVVGTAPLGAIVATASLLGCVPIVHDGTARNCVDVRPGRGSGSLRLDTPDGREDITDISTQLPLGDYTPGRWAWLLAAPPPAPSPLEVARGPFRARFDGHCAGCNTAIHEGQQIVRLSDDTHRHHYIGCLP